MRYIHRKSYSEGSWRGVSKTWKVFKQNESWIPSPSLDNQTIRPLVNKFISRNVRINMQTNITKNFNTFREIWKQKPTHVRRTIWSVGMFDQTCCAFDQTRCAFGILRKPNPNYKTNRNPDPNPSLSPSPNHNPSLNSNPIASVLRCAIRFVSYGV